MANLEVSFANLEKKKRKRKETEGIIENYQNISTQSNLKSLIHTTIEIIQSESFNCSVFLFQNIYKKKEEKTKILSNRTATKRQIRYSRYINKRNKTSTKCIDKLPDHHWLVKPELELLGHIPRHPHHLPNPHSTQS